MKHSFLIFVILLFVSFQTFSQRDIPLDIDTNSINPEQIPSAAKLKIMGATDKEVQEISDFKARKLKEAEKEKEAATKAKLASETDKSNKGNSSTIGIVQNPATPAITDTDLGTIFGHSFFKNNNIKFYDKANQLKAPDNYILGVGDELNISIWGYSDFNGVFTIDENGAINPRLVGRIYLNGLAFKDAKILIANKFKTVYDLNNSQIDVTLSYSKIITVNVVGEVNNPGSYTVPSINTAFNILATVGGIRPIGSVRQIYLRRGGKTIKTLDVYKYLMNPDSKEDFFLENNDYILVPSSGRVVKINGQVKRPLEYELIDQENLKSLIEFAGGFEAGAYRKRIQVKRFLNNQETIIDVDYDSLTNAKKDFELFGGDEVLVRKVPIGYSNFVELTGSVKLPGNYELRQGDKITDVIKRAEGLLEDVFDSRAYVIRLNPDLSKQYIPFSLKEVMANPNATSNIKLQNLDVIKIFSKSYFKDEFKFSVIGAVRSPGDYTYGDGLMLKDALYLAGGLKKEAAFNRIEVSRAVDFVSSSGTIIPIRAIVKTIEIADDLRLDQNSEVFAIQPYDQIMVRTEPKFELQKNIVIKGEVMYPGEYSILNKNEKITDVLKRAGGITLYAFPQGATLKRVEFNEGFLFFKLQEVLKDSSSIFNYILKAGDTLIVPKVDQLIQLTGAIRYPNIQELKQISAPFTKRKSARYYIKTYGLGFDKKTADKKKTYVIESGGYVRGTKHFLFFKRYPKVTLGSTVVVPTKPIKEKDKKKGEPIDWNKAIENTTVKLTGLATLWLIFSSLAK
jgi:protein involved in polysaccharide export with SLBB domain